MGDLSISKVFFSGLVENTAPVGNAARVEKSFIDMVVKPAKDGGIPTEYNVPMTKTPPKQITLPETDRDIPYSFGDMGLGYGELFGKYENITKDGFTVSLGNNDGSFKRTIICDAEGNCLRFSDTVESSNVFRKDAVREKEILWMDYNAQGELRSLDVILINQFNKIYEHYNYRDGFKEPSGQIEDPNGHVIYTYPKEGLRL